MRKEQELDGSIQISHVPGESYGDELTRSMHQN
jgi:hypothetical protein